MSIKYLHLAPDQDPPRLDENHPFRAVVVLGMATSPDWRAIVSKWLVDSGCLYMMAWGEGSSDWDDSVDIACLEAFDFGEVPDDRFVITTWHDRESLSETFWFSEHLARHPTVSIAETIIVDVGPRERRVSLTQMLEDARRRTSSPGDKGSR